MAEENDRPGILDRAKALFAAACRKSRLLDHGVNMVKHYGNVQGNMLAGSVTYFAFLSFFPILVLAFAVIGWVAIVFPNAEGNLVSAIQQVFPGIVTLHGQHNTISMQQIKNAKVFAGIIGFIGVLYSGLGWMSALRAALQGAFQIPPSKKYNPFVGKAIDLLVMAILGLVLVVSVATSEVVKTFADDLLGSVGAGSYVGAPLSSIIGILFGLIASTLLFFVMYRLLGAPDLSAKALWRGALLAAFAFELLKLLVVNVLGAVGGTPFAPLAIAITLVIWINYFSRFIIYGASWAMTSSLSANALALRAARQLADEQAKKAGEPDATSVLHPAPAPARVPAARPAPPLSRGFDAGSAIAGAAAAAVALLVFWRRE